MKIKNLAMIAVLAIVVSLFISCASTSYSDVKDNVKNSKEREKEEFHNAAMLGDIENVKRYMNSGIDVNLQDNGGRTALLFASRNGYTEIARLLIDAGADINLKNNDGWTALIFASHGNNLELARLLIDAKADVNVQNKNGDTALMIATRNGYTEIEKLLIDAGADVNLRNKDGWTASMIASQYANEFNLDQYGTGRLRLIKVDGEQLSYLARCYKLPENNMKRYLSRRWDMTSFICGNWEYWTEEVEYRDIYSFPTSYQTLIQEYDVICTSLEEVPLGIHPDIDEREMYILVVDRKNNKVYFSCGKII